MPGAARVCELRGRALTYFIPYFEPSLHMRKTLEPYRCRQVNGSKTVKGKRRPLAGAGAAAAERYSLSTAAAAAAAAWRVGSLGSRSAKRGRGYM